MSPVKITSPVLSDNCIYYTSGWELRALSLPAAMFSSFPFYVPLLPCSPPALDLQRKEKRAWRDTSPTLKTCHPDYLTMLNYVVYNEHLFIKRYILFVPSIYLIKKPRKSWKTRSQMTLEWNHRTPGLFLSQVFRAHISYLQPKLLSSALLISM